MTATEELRRLLDERGVEYEVDEQGWVFFDIDGFGWIYVPSDTHGQLIHQRLFITPEQAIDATLGRGTCKQEERGWSTEGDHARVWLTCGHDCMVETVADLPNFCPICGAKVVDE